MIFEMAIAFQRDGPATPTPKSDVSTSFKTLSEAVITKCEASVDAGPRLGRYWYTDAFTVARTSAWMCSSIIGFTP